MTRAIAFRRLSRAEALVHGERLGPQLGSGGGDRGITVAPVMAASREEAHRGALAAHDQPVPVVLDLVHPVGPGRAACNRRPRSSSDRRTACYRRRMGFSSIMNPQYGALRAQGIPAGHHDATRFVYFWAPPNRFARRAGGPLLRRDGLDG